MDRKTLGILFAGLFLVMVGFGIIIPALPYYTLELQGNATTVGLLMASYSVMNFLCAPLWGRLSDRIGRKPVLVTGIAGLGISFILFGLGSTLPELFGARIIGGILGAAALPTAFAYVGDHSPPESRAKYIGMLGAALGLGMVVGPAIGGFAGLYGHHVPFLVAGASSFVTAAFIAAKLPGGLPPATAHKSGWRQALQETGAALWPYYLLAFVQTFAFTTMEATFALFAKDRFALGIGHVAGILTLMSFVSAGVQGGLVGRLVSRHGVPAIVKAGCLILGIGFLGMTVVASTWQMVVAMTVIGIGSALMRSSLTTGVSTGAHAGQGTAMGLLQSFESLARVFGPAIGGLLYVLGPSEPYVAASVLMAIALALSLMSLQARASVSGGGPNQGMPNAAR